MKQRAVAHANIRSAKKRVIYAKIASMKDEQKSPLAKQPRACKQGNSKQVDADDRTTKSTLTSKKKSKEINGPNGLEPTRYGDWEAKGRCFDF